MPSRILACMMVAAMLALAPACRSAREAEHDVAAAVSEGMPGSSSGGGLDLPERASATPRTWVPEPGLAPRQSRTPRGSRPHDPLSEIGLYPVNEP